MYPIVHKRLSMSSILWLIFVRQGNYFLIGYAQEEPERRGFGETGRIEGGEESGCPFKSRTSA